MTQDKNYILGALPEHYRLYEHIKYNKASEGSQRSGKSHAAGANERQDAYLYGHPNGRKKRFRSPNEFFPHLLWLATDEAGDPNNCSCKFCTPEEMAGSEPSKEAKQRTPSASEADTKPKAPALSRPSDVLKQPPKERKPPPTNNPTIPNPQIGRVNPTNFPQASAPRPSNAKLLEPNMLPRARSMEQRLDSQAQKHLYRPGEVVWFKKGLAWGLGVVQRRDNTPTVASPYRIQPLSHPFQHPNVLVLAQHELRPWLAWSPPPTTCPQLRPGAHNNYQVYRYESIDWTNYLQGAYGAGDPEVDGSILAAKQAESTYTPFDAISQNPIANTPQPQGIETHWNGMFIGAEKVWVGDALRLRTGHFPTDIMVLHDIVEQPRPGSNGSYTSSTSRIQLVGDTYTISVVELQPHLVPKDTLHLPPRVREDLNFKNALTKNKPDPTHRYTSYWRLTQKSVKLSLDDIKGRWYESALLLPILNPELFSKRGVAGDIPDACNFMNGHGDCNRPPAGTPGVHVDQASGQTRSKAADVRVEKREETFGRAVPPQFHIHRGLDEGKDAPRPGSSGGNGMGEGRDWMDVNTGVSRGSTRPSSIGSTPGQGSASTPGTSPGVGGYGEGDINMEDGLFQEGSQGVEGLGDVGMGGT